MKKIIIKKLTVSKHFKIPENVSSNILDDIFESMKVVKIKTRTDKNKINKTLEYTLERIEIENKIESELCNYKKGQYDYPLVMYSEIIELKSNKKIDWPN